MCNLQQILEIEIDESGYPMGEILMQGGALVCYHLGLFHGAVLNYPTYDQELYARVQEINKWKHYLLGNGFIIHNNHHPL
jgi:hypothetical protein